MVEKAKENIVKARFHHGSNSMDITIPSSVVKKSDVTDGDLFRVTITEENGHTIIKYERIYKTKQKTK